MARIIIIGNGPAGRRAAETIRKETCDVSIVVVTDESCPFYPRPRLTVGYLAGEVDRDALFMKPDFYSKSAVSLLFETVAAVRPESNEVIFEGGGALSYTALLVATGAMSSWPPWEGSGLDGVCTLRTLKDTDDILDRMKGVERVVVSGGGILGVEIAEAARKRGKEVFFLVRKGREAVGAPNLTPEKCEERCGKMEQSGIEVLTRHEIVKFSGTERLEMVHTSTGRTIEAALAVVAIGMKPNICSIKGSGINTNKGIIVDAELRTNYENIFAAGDVAELCGEGAEKQKYGAPYSAAMKQGEYAAGKILEFIRG